MAKRKYFLIIDTETTMGQKVADFGAVVVDKHGTIYNRCSILVRGVFGIDPLFYIPNEDAEATFSQDSRDRRFVLYNEMIEQGSRQVATVAAINRWLEQVAAKYNPTLTAYNLPFDVDKSQNTGIDLSMFNSRFCLWRACVWKFAHTKKYLNFVMQTHAFNPPTKFGNMSFKTNAEVMSRFMANDPDMPNEPHMAIEDVIGYELPLLVALVKNTKVKDYMNPDLSFNWREVQVKDHFTAKPKLKVAK